MVINQQDADAGSDITVLESIVKQNHVDILTCLTIDETTDATRSFLIHGDGDIRELLFDLERLVTDIVHRRVVVGQQETTALPFVATTEDGEVRLVLQQTDEVLHVRGLTRSANGDVAH